MRAVHFEDPLWGSQCPVPWGRDAIIKRLGGELLKYFHVVLINGKVRAGFAHRTFLTIENFISKHYYQIIVGICLEYPRSIKTCLNGGGAQKIWTENFVAFFQSTQRERTFIVSFGQTTKLKQLSVMGFDEDVSWYNIPWGNIKPHPLFCYYHIVFWFAIHHGISMSEWIHVKTLDF